MADYTYQVKVTDDFYLGEDQRLKVTPGGEVTIKGGLVSSGNVGGVIIAGTRLSVSGAIGVGFEKKSTAAAAIALSATAQVSLVTSTGAHGGTLANGQTGQIKEIYMVADGGDFVLTPANLEGAATTLTFGDVGDYIKLIFDGTSWCIVQNQGVVVG